MAPAGTATLPLPIKRLPIIDVAPLLPKGASKLPLEAALKRKETVDALHNACLNYGFFYLDLKAYLDITKPEELGRLGKEFFMLPQEEKDKFTAMNQDRARGYSRLKESVTKGNPDNLEALEFYKPVDKPDKTKFLGGENQWPSVPKFKESCEEWVEKMKGLGLIVMEAMSEGLGMTNEEWKELRAQVNDSFWALRLIGYPPLPNDHDGFSCGEHRDYGCLTFLWADPTPNALQVLSPRPRTKQVDISGPKLPLKEETEEGTWISADPLPGCVVCNIGEMWEVWTNGLYQSTLHRVIHRGTNYRISIPFFFEPNIDGVVKPLDAALRIQGRTRRDVREPLVYGDYLQKKAGNLQITRDAGIN